MYSLVRITKLALKRSLLSQRLLKIQNCISELKEFKCANCPTNLRRFDFAVGEYEGIRYEKRFPNKTYGSHPKRYYCVKCAVTLDLDVKIPKRILEYEGAINVKEGDHECMKILS